MSEDVKKLLSSAELANVTKKNNLKAGFIVFSDWTLIIGIFVAASTFPNPLTIFFAILLLGGRQMALGVLVHETGHQSFFTSQKINNFVGTWLSGYWIFSDKTAYMRVHLLHHKNCGTKNDPDLKNFDAYPVSGKSLTRKIFRDISGRIGWRRVLSIGKSIYRFNELKPSHKKMIINSIFCNVCLWGTLALCGHGWLYLLWPAAFMTTHMFISRIRQIAEHAAVPSHFDEDTRRNTRTVYLNSLETILVAPHGLNFHLEHHLIPSVPIYRLQKLHRMLLKKGYYQDIIFIKGYRKLLRHVTHFS